jgi:hypothetical protein
LADALDPGTWSQLETVQAAQRAGRCDGAGVMLGALGDKGTLAAVRLLWCFYDDDDIAVWVEPFLSLLQAAWVEFDPTGHGCSALFRLADGHAARLQHAVRNVPPIRFWRTIGGVRRAGIAEPGAAGRFLPMSGNPIDDYVNEDGLWHRDAPADLPLLSWKVPASAFTELDAAVRETLRRRDEPRSCGAGGLSSTVVPFAAPPR